MGHFLGLHTLQAPPLIGWLLTLARARLSDGRRLVLVWIAGLGYLGLTLLVTWQALRGQPLTAPDGLTLASVVVLALAVGTAAGAAILSGDRCPRSLLSRRAPALSVTGEH